MTKKEKRIHVVRLMEILGGDDINYREAEYIRRKINALRGLTYDGRVKRCGVKRRDPVMIQINKIHRLISEDRKEHGGKRRSQY